MKIDKNEPFKKKGRPKTCKICSHQFKFQQSWEESKWHSERMPCPKCKGRYCCLPKTERQLMELQYTFLQERDTESINKMYAIMVNYTKSLILKYKSNVIENEDDLEYYAQNAVSFVIEDYYRKPEYKVKSSFGGLLKKKIYQAIGGSLEKDSSLTKEDISIDTTDTEGLHIHQLPSDVDLIDQVNQQQDAILILEFILKLVNGVYRFCLTKEEYLRVLVCVRNYFRSLKNGELVVDKLFTEWGRYGKDKFDSTLCALRSELTKLSKL